VNVESERITIRLKLFSSAKDLAGFDERLVDIPPDSKSEAVLTYLAKHNPLFERWKKSLRIAVNMEYVDNQHLLHDGDEVAVIPPVSGG
jgi:molybdopterin synthase sulfur carrier subunit